MPVTLSPGPVTQHPSLTPISLSGAASLVPAWQPLASLALRAPCLPSLAHQLAMVPWLFTASPQRANTPAWWHGPPSLSPHQPQTVATEPDLGDPAPSSSMSLPLPNALHLSHVFPTTDVASHLDLWPLLHDSQSSSVFTWGKTLHLTSSFLLMIRKYVSTDQTFPVNFRPPHTLPPTSPREVHQAAQTSHIPH